MRVFKSAQRLSITKKIPALTEYLSTFAQLFVYGLLYVAFAKFGMAYMATVPTNITLIWLSVGVAVMMLQRHGAWALPVIFTASYIANAPGMSQSQYWPGVLHTGIAASIDTLGPWLVSTLIYRHVPKGLRYLNDLLNLVIKVCVVPMALTAVALTTNLIVGGYIGVERFFIYVNKLLLSDLLGVILVYAVYDAYRRHESARELEHISSAVVALSTALLLMVAAKFWLAGVIFLIIPVFLMFAFSCTNRYVYLVLTLANAALIVIFSNDFGPFAQPLELQSQIMLQAFIFTLSLLTIGVCVIKAQLALVNDSRQYWRELARFDDLTGLLQRNAFMEILSKRLQSNGFTNVGSCILVADLDLFKNINDQFGHKAGDTVLTAVADCFRSQLREHDLAARFGGEEFVLFFNGASLEQGRKIAERIRQAVSAASFAQYPELTVTISMGVAQVDYQHSDPFNVAFSQADGLLYEAKKEGRNRVVS